MGIQIGAKPDSGFDDPLGMLRDCHRRIEHFVQVLTLVADRAHGKSLTDEETSAVEAALHYFRVGGLRHNADEEESLFPRLRAASAEEGARIGALEHDHGEAAKLHAEIEALYRSWIGQGKLDLERSQRLQAASLDLKQIYAEHIAIEEQTVFPRAAELLNPEEITAMGREFRDRRQ